MEAVAHGASEPYRQAMFTAWHVEAFARTKRMPRLDKLMQQMAPRQHQRRVITKDEAVGFVEALNKAFGGIDKRKRQTTTKDMTDG